MVAAYNEEAGLEGSVTDVFAALSDVESYEVIIVDDASTDATAEIADRLAEQHPRVRAIHHEVNRGLAAVYRTGLEAATMDYYTWVSGDHQIEAQSVYDIVQSIGKADLVVPHHATIEDRAWYRRLLTWFSTGQINMLFGWSLRYYQGPTVYPRTLALSIPVKNTGFFFASEMLIRALDAGHSWTGVGIRHQRKQPGLSSAVKLTNLVTAQLSVMSLWWSLRVSFNRPSAARSADLAWVDPAAGAPTSKW
jgi:glycosyltransferase involved in cell wall biosynthesis